MSSRTGKGSGGGQRGGGVTTTASAARAAAPASRGGTASGGHVRPAGAASNVQNTRKIFVGGLHYGTDDAGLRAYFSRYGAVESAQVMYNRDTAKSRGFGFVVFMDEASVDAALDGGQYQLLDDKDVELKRSVPKSAMPAVPAPAPQSTPSAAAAAARSPGGSVAGQTAGPHSTMLSDVIAGVATSPTGASSRPPVVTPSKGAAAAPVVNTAVRSPQAVATTDRGGSKLTAVVSPTAAIATTPSGGKTPSSKGTSWLGAVTGRSTAAPSSVGADAAAGAQPPALTVAINATRAASSFVPSPVPDGEDGDVLIPASSASVDDHAGGSDLGLGSIADDLLSVASRLTGHAGGRPHAPSDAGSIASSVYSAPPSHRARGATSDSLQLTSLALTGASSGPLALPHRQDSSDSAASMAALALSNMDMGTASDAAVGAFSSMASPMSQSGFASARLSSAGSTGSARLDAASVGSMMSSTATPPAHRHSADVMDSSSASRLRDSRHNFSQGGLIGLPDALSSFARDRGGTWDGAGTAHGSGSTTADASDRASLASGSSFGGGGMLSGHGGLPLLSSGGGPVTPSHSASSARSQPMHPPSPPVNLPPGLLTPTRSATAAGGGSSVSPVSAGSVNASPGMPLSPAGVMTSLHSSASLLSADSGGTGISLEVLMLMQQQQQQHTAAAAAAYASGALWPGAPASPASMAAAMAAAQAQYTPPRGGYPHGGSMPHAHHPHAGYPSMSPMLGEEAMRALAAASTPPPGAGSSETVSRALSSYAAAAARGAGPASPSTQTAPRLPPASGELAPPPGLPRMTSWGAPPAGVDPSQVSMMAAFAQAMSGGGSPGSSGMTDATLLAAFGMSVLQNMSQQQQMHNMARAVMHMQAQQHAAAMAAVSSSPPPLSHMHGGGSPPTPPGMQPQPQYAPLSASTAAAQPFVPGGHASSVAHSMYGHPHERAGTSTSAHGSTAAPRMY